MWSMEAAFALGSAVLYDGKVDGAIAAGLTTLVNPGRQLATVGALEITLPYVKGIAPERLVDLRESLPDAFLAFRAMLSSIVRERHFTRCRFRGGPTKGSIRDLTGIEQAGFRNGIGDSQSKGQRLGWSSRRQRGRTRRRCSRGPGGGGSGGHAWYCQRVRGVRRAQAQSTRQSFYFL